MSALSPDQQRVFADLVAAALRVAEACVVDVGSCPVCGGIGHREDGKLVESCPVLAYERARGEL